MKASNARLSYFFYILACLFIIFASCPDSKVFAQSGLKPDIVVRIANINEALLTIEQLAGKKQSENAMVSAKGFVDGFFKGTDWLDPGRALVLGIIFDEKSPENMPHMAALVPFSKPNQDFVQAYNALSKDNYFLIPLPPGSNAQIAHGLESALEIASKKPLKRFLSIDMSAASAMKKVDASIEQMIKNIGAKTQQQESRPDDSSGGGIEAKQAEALMTGFCALLKQVEKFSVGLDLNRQEIELISMFRPEKGSEFADFLNSQIQVDKSVLGDFEFFSNPGIRFRTTAFDMSGATVLAEKYFGDFYRLAGIDFQKAGSVIEPFSGETAGIVEIKPSGLAVEAVSCIKPDHKLSFEFLESQYIPWLLEAGQNMAETYQSQYPGLIIEPVFIRSKNSTVADTSVAGVEGRIPFIQKDGEAIKVLRMPLRMSITGQYMLVAPDDVRMAGLIERVSGLEPAPYKGPAVHMTMNLAKLVSAAAAMAPGGKVQDADSLPDMGEIEYIVELAEQQLSSKYRIKTGDAEKLRDYFTTAMATQEKQARASGPAAEGKKSFLPETENQKPVKEYKDPKKGDDPETVHEKFSKDHPRYWTEKGGLYLAYGNTEAALKHFEKAVEMDRQNPAAHYNLGLAYSEKEAFEKALESIERSLALDPGNGRYLYAKGWILIQAGNRQKGLAAIEQAAESSNTDALRYLKKIASRQ